MCYRDLSEWPDGWYIDSLSECMCVTEISVSGLMDGLFVIHMNMEKNGQKVPAHCYLTFKSKTGTVDQNWNC